MQRDELVEKRGPTLDRAYDSFGKPTPAAEGFARGQGIAAAELVTRENYVYAVRTVQGEPAGAVLPEIGAKLLESMRWPKAMRWNQSGKSWPRPLRWIVALYGDSVVSFAWADVVSGSVSRGPRFADAAAQLPAGDFTTFAVPSADGYFDAVAAQGVILDRATRQQRIAEVVQSTAAAIGGSAPDEPALLEEVTDLVEAPFGVLGHFEEKFLDIPMPVLIGVMKKHQRYYPVIKDGAMLPNFITIANSAHLADPDAVREGNEDVIRARYADAAYFYRQDSARTLDSFTPRLSTLTFHEKLGSMGDKVKRLETLAPEIARQLGASESAIATTTRAAALSKSDLVTNMVVEMTSLQGVMGEIYAKASGEPAEVALAIREHYLPRSAGDANPTSIPGLALSLADKLDSLIGLFAVNAIPTGSADPFGLRRAALGVVNNLLAAKVAFSVRDALAQAAQLQPVEVSAASTNETATFVEKRLQGVLLEEGYDFDVVDAVLAVRGSDPVAAKQAVDALGASVAQPWWPETFTAYARTARITRTVADRLALAPEAYVEDVEHALHSATLAAQEALADAQDPAAVLGDTLHTLTPAINAYFEKVLVNAEDPTLRYARLALLQRIAALPERIADLSKLQGF